MTFTMTPTKAGTLLRMEQAGFRPNQKQAYGGANAGWKWFLAKLEQVLVRLEYLGRAPFSSAHFQGRPP